MTLCLLLCMLSIVSLFDIHRFKKNALSSVKSDFKYVSIYLFHSLGQQINLKIRLEYDHYCFNVNISLLRQSTVNHSTWKLGGFGIFKLLENNCFAVKPLQYYKWWNDNTKYISKSRPTKYANVARILFYTLST